MAWLLRLVLPALFEALAGALERDRARRDLFEAGAVAAELNAERARLREAVRSAEADDAVRRMTARELMECL